MTRVAKCRKPFPFFDLFNYAFFLVLGVLMLYPFWHTFVGSIMTFAEFTTTSFMVFPRNPTAQAYRQIIESGAIFRPFANTVVVTVVHTVTSVLFTAFVAYGAAKRYPGHRIIMAIFVLSLYFDAGLIPNYILFKELSLLNTYGIYIIPSLLNVWNLIIFRTTFLAFDQNLVEAAKIDGYSEYRIFAQIVMPLSMATIAALSVFSAVGMWNNLFTSLFFVIDPSKKLLQEYLYRIVTESSLDGNSAAGMDVTGFVPTETMKLANTMITVVPIILVYPFLQKYFTKGVMLGAVKG